MLDTNSSVPLYEQLKTALKEAMQKKEYRPGERMPSEPELGEKYKVSRITVRRAVKELCDEGILVRQQGKGTFVLEKADYRRLDKSAGVGVHEYMELSGRKARAEILEKMIIKPKPAYARDLAIDSTDDVVYLKRLMFVDEMPMMIDTSYLPVKRFPGIYDKLEGDVALFRLIRQEYGVKLERYYKVLKVQKANREMSNYLSCKVGDPMFDLFKITYDSNQVPQNISISIMKGENTYYVLSSSSDDDEINQSGLSWRV